RRRHTRWPRDWSSDVCSSDLRRWLGQPIGRETEPEQQAKRDDDDCNAFEPNISADAAPHGVENATDSLREPRGVGWLRHVEKARSEERRVGKVWRWRLWA